MGCIYSVTRILNNPIYLGRPTQLRTKTVSYKKHKVIQKDESEWAVIENNHEPIISQKLCDKVQLMNASVATGRHTKGQKLRPLSGLCYCADCGSKMRHNGGCKSNYTASVYVCSRYSKYGKNYCTTHTIRQPLLESLVLADIQRQIDIVMNEPDYS